MPHAHLSRRIAILALAAGLSLCSAVPAGAVAAPAQGERQRDEIARAMHAGEARCLARNGNKGDGYGNEAGGYGDEADGYGPGMMNGGGYGGRGHYPRAMMGSGVHNGPELSTLGGALIAIASAAIGAGVAVLFTRRRGQPPPSAAR